MIHYIVTRGLFLAAVMLSALFLSECLGRGF